MLSDAFPLVLLGIIGIGVYVASCLFNPMVTCRKRRGQPRPRGWLFSNAHHLCPKCEGTGHQARLGRKLLDRLRGECAKGDPDITRRWPWTRQAPPY